MTNTSWFPNAQEARNNIIKDQAVHQEIRGIENSILADVALGNYDTTVINTTTFTDTNNQSLTIRGIDPATSYINIPNHPFSMGDTVILSSTGYLPPPLKINGFYYVIYVDQNTIKLAASKSSALINQPVAIEFSQGVGSITVNNHGSGYLTPPTVTINNDGGATIGATATAILQYYGAVGNVSVITQGSGFTDNPSATIEALGTGAAVGTISFSIVSGNTSTNPMGQFYSIGDILTVVGGVGTAATFSVTGVIAGGITSVNLLDGGNYTVLPTSLTNCPTVSETGTGATVDITAGILSIPVISGGTGYLQLPIIEITGGGGSGATASAVLAGSAINNINVTNPGSGYTSQPTINIISGGGATVTTRLVPTTLGSVTLTDTSSTYTSIPTVSVVSAGSGATANNVLMKVISASLVNGGSGYSTGDILYVSGGTAVQSAQIKVLSVDSNGAVVTFSISKNGSYSSLPQLNSNYVIDNRNGRASFDLVMGVLSATVATGGSGYVVEPLVVFHDPTQTGGGTGASGYCKISGGSVSSIMVDNAGSGYKAMPTVSITVGDGAQVSATLQPTSIGSISITNGGSGYSVPPQIVITGGGGSGAIAVAVITGGSISAVNLTNAGSGYTSTPRISVTGNAQLAANLSPTSIQSLEVYNAGNNYISVPQIKVGDTIIATASLTPTGIGSIDVLSGGSLYDTPPLLVWSLGPNQVGQPSLPVTQVNLQYGVDSVAVNTSGNGYTSAPSITFSNPTTSGGTTATATANLSVGAGDFSIQQYLPSNDYYAVWKSLTPSDTRLARIYADQMNAVIKYFTDLGYTINRITNPSTGNSMSWRIQW